MVAGKKKKVQTIYQIVVSENENTRNVKDNVNSGAKRLRESLSDRENLKVVC